MASLIDAHFARVETALTTGYSLKNRGDWICKHTVLRREPFTFKDHEYQKKLIECDAQEILTRKCSQIGISELQIRDALAMVNVMPGFTVIYTLPTAAFSKTFARTRADPVIEASPELKRKLNTLVDSGEVKQFGDSFIYFRGTKGMTAAISVPADCLVHDEYDFSDLTVLSSYHSRLTHSPYKLKRKFSTPTVNGWGISAEFDVAQQYWNLVKCEHCNLHFLPDYFTHVKIPGFDRDLREIKSDNIHLTRWQEAKVHCPGCGKTPSLDVEHREWVLKNPETGTDVVAFQIQPFDAPRIITPAQLIKDSTSYERYLDFINFGLGLPGEDKETSFTKDELEALFVLMRRFTPWANVMGVDMGQDCHIMVWSVGPNNKADCLHCEKVPVGLLEKRRDELRAQFNVVLTVMDSQPYFDMLMRMQQRDPNLWGAMFSNRKNLDVWSTTLKEEDPEKGRPKMRVVDLNRNKALDVFMDFVRSGSWSVLETPYKDSVIAHLMDMKRIKTMNEDNELEFAWQKSAKKQDHFHHAALYAFIASRLLSTVTLAVPAPFLMSSFKLKTKV